jgi:8-oxo-dGTP diphosphatase
MQPNELYFAVLAVDIVCFRIINNALCVLVGKVTSASGFDGMWGFVGGLIRPEETADESVERHLRDKSGISDIYKEQLYTFSDINRDKRGRVVSVAYIALAGEDPQDVNKAKIETKWQPIESLPKLAYDHDEIFKRALHRLQAKIRYSNIAQNLLPEEFTFSDMQKVYEIVLGRKLDKRNFRKKILATDMIKDTKLTRKAGVMRPAVLYKFTSKKFSIFEIM